MIAELTLVIRSVTSQLQFGDLFGNEGPIESVLDVVTAVFSLLLFMITLYAWARRGRQPTLLIVSIGFLTFFIKQFVEILPLSRSEWRALQLRYGFSNADFILLRSRGTTKTKCKVE